MVAANRYGNRGIQYQLLAALVHLILSLFEPFLKRSAGLGTLYLVLWTLSLVRN